MSETKRWLSFLLFLLVLRGDTQSRTNYNKRMAENKNWIVTLSNNRPLKEVKKELIQTGFTVDQVLSEIGCITGSASEEVVIKLRSIPGVADISREKGIDIGPPDAEISW